MDNVWVAPILGLVGVLAGAILSGFISEKHSKEVTRRIVQMLVGGAEHRDRARAMEAQHAHLSLLISVCMDLQYQLLTLNEICEALLADEDIPDMGLPLQINGIRGADLSQDVVAALANVRAHAFLADPAGVSGNAHAWRSRLSVLQKACENALRLVADELASLETQQKQVSQDLSDSKSGQASG